MTANWAILGDPEIIVRLVLQVFLFMGSALFSMSETALFSVRDSDIQRLENQRHPAAGRIRDLIDEPRQLIVSILCGNELINIAATVNLAGILLQLLGDPQDAAFANTIVMLPLLLLFGEITPKTLAVTQPVRLCTSIVEPAITAWVRVVMPLRTAIHFASDRVTALIVGAERSEQNILGTDEFRTLLLDVEKAGVVNAAEHRVILNLIEAGSTDITQIMVPRPRIAFIDADLPASEIIGRFRAYRHRRLPVYRTHRDRVIGILKEERVLEIVAAKPMDDITLDDLLEPATFVPTTQSIGGLAEFFKEGDHHAALVVNEFGGIEGLVTADDVFGFLTAGSSIHLNQHSEVKKVEDGRLYCYGLTPIQALKRMVSIPAGEDVRMSTVGGLIMTLMNRVPRTGDEIAVSGLVLRVLSMDGLLVDRVLVAPAGHAALDETAETVS